MAFVEIFTTNYCPYCVRAKQLLTRKGVAFTEYDVSHDDEREAEMIRRARGTSVPQIFIDGRAVGGSDDLHALERAGELDRLLGSAPAT